MKIKLLSTLSIASLLSFGILSCNNGNNEISSEENTNTDQKVSITLNPVGQSPQFTDAKLSIDDIKTEKDGENVNIALNYGVKNYELKAQTEDAATKGCNNSKDGQHIHFILDNTPYEALYEPTHTFSVPLNSEHYVMSFLSRSYHESVKAKDAGVLLHFKVDENGKLSKLDIPSHPMIFASRPKGDYLGKDTEKVLFDFYVHNATIGEDALVKATINGTEFDIKNWEAYFIEHADMGELHINLQLTDLEGNPLSGENTSVHQIARLAKEEPMQ